MNWLESMLERLLTRACTRARSESSRAAELLVELTGKRVALCIAGTPFEQRPLIIESTGQVLTLAPREAPAAGETSARPQASVHGAPLSLLSLMGPDPQAVIHRGDVRIAGDAQLVQRFEELGRLLAPDLEQALSQVLGRSAAHVLIGGARAAASTAREVAWTGVRNVAEYFAHERGDLLSRSEAAHFLHGVEQAREQLDRLEARLTQLERQADGLAGGAEPA